MGSCGLSSHLYAKASTDNNFIYLLMTNNTKTIIEKIEK